ncbi:MAG: PPC domain-containing protein [Pseudanabaenaceae cyanobacterium bins.39]|nr:PPC domain-containing protein [Pseudanabaenaceae cyanobacterium bins.39]
MNFHHIKHQLALSRLQKSRLRTSRLDNYGLTLIKIAIAIGIGSISYFLPNQSSQAQNPTNASINPYRPIPVNLGIDLEDILTDKDIPTGQKGFARDYIISANKDERIEVSVNSKSFDTVLSLLDRKGEVIAENDDASNSETNSLIFFRFRESGQYIIRVSSFGGSSGGKFTLQVNRLQVVR